MSETGKFTPEGEWEDTDFLRAHDGTWFSPHHVIRVRRAITDAGPGTVHPGVWARVEADLTDGSVVILSKTGDLRRNVSYLDHWESFWVQAISAARRRP